MPSPTAQLQFCGFNGAVHQNPCLTCPPPLRFNCPPFGRNRQTARKPLSSCTPAVPCDRVCEQESIPSSGPGPLNMADCAGWLVGRKMEAWLLLPHFVNMRFAVVTSQVRVRDLNTTPSIPREHLDSAWECCWFPVRRDWFPSMQWCRGG